MRRRRGYHPADVPQAGVCAGEEREAVSEGQNGLQRLPEDERR